MFSIKLMSFLLAAFTLVGCSKSHSEITAPSDGLHKGDTLRVAVYRGTASCNNCAYSVQSAIEKMGVKCQIDFVGPNEEIDITDKTLSHYDIYVQPGGGQNLVSGFNSLGDERVAAIRNYVAQGGRYLGLCMGAYLAEASYIGLVDYEMESEAGRPGFPVTTIEDAAVIVNWMGRKEYIFFQDGPYLLPKTSDKKFLKIASYENGDLAAARYSYGNGLVVLAGPHPEADSSWFDDAGLSMEERPTSDLFKELIESFYR